MNGCDESVDDLCLTMLAVGDQLAAALAREHRLSRRGYKHPDDLTVLNEWKDSRRMVDTLSEQYTAAIMRYRQAVERAIRLESEARKVRGNHPDETDL